MEMIMILMLLNISSVINFDSFAFLMKSKKTLEIRKFISFDCKSFTKETIFKDKNSILTKFNAKSMHLSKK